MFGFFKRLPEERRRRFVEHFIQQHYSTYRPEDAGMDKVIEDAQKAWEAINGKE